MYNNPMTLKSRLRVTQGHHKLNHWTDHTRLSSSQVFSAPAGGDPIGMS